ncbi:hypothetical protein [Marinobacterium sedimentorum]|uniref:hypothetical protein n=1 Tax=Marinobacterium sedimentorum TaxID=2927804 RepID=UPI0020C63C5C|nr:hypothetical protein [Marinobacterium sedimentorum]MCP8688095.1 hypothetical protein [Marinobacterium sedimentorum]
MDAELPMRHRDVTSAASEKSFQRAVVEAASGVLSLDTFFARAKKVSRQQGAMEVTNSHRASSHAQNTERQGFANSKYPEFQLIRENAF